MNVDTLSSSSLATTSPVSSTSRAVRGTDADGDGDGDHGRRAGRHQRSGGGGEVGQAVAAALQALGIALPTPSPSATTSASTGTTATDGTGAAATATAGTSSTGSTASASTVREDLGKFMHALFDAVRSAQTSAGSTATGAASVDNSSGTTDPIKVTNTTGTGSSAPPEASGTHHGHHGARGDFASGLAALMTQVAGGQAPGALQDAFTQLKADLSAPGGGDTINTNPGTVTTTGPTGSSGSTQATLQAFLTKLQAGLGYGSTAPATGVLLTASA